MTNHLFTIPTNRPCWAAASSYLEELELASEATGTKFEYLVFGDGTGEVERINAKAFSERPLRRGHAIHFVPRRAQVDHVRSVIEAADIPEPDKVLSMLCPPPGTCSYGAVLNRTFLVAISRGIRHIHRRDSDTRFSRATGSPLACELAHLGRAYSELPELRSTLGAPICFVGGRYTGEWPADLKLLYERDPQLLYRYVALTHPELDLAEVVELVHKRYFAAAPDCTELVRDPLIELGNCAFFEAFRHYPVSTATDTMGTDYFVQDLLGALGLPAVSHPFTVEHFYTEERRDRDWQFNYHMRFPRFKIYNALMHRFQARVTRRFSAVASIDELPSAASVAVELRAEAEAWQERAEPKQILDALAEVYGDSAVPQFMDVAEAIRRHSGRLVTETLDGVREFANLLTLWPELVRAAGTVPLEMDMCAITETAS